MRYIKRKRVIILLLIYLAVTIFMLLKNNIIYSNIVNPAFWTILTIALAIAYQNNHGRFPKKKYYNGKMIIITIIYLILFFYLGFIIGFSSSPYSQSFKAIIKNFISFVVPIIGIEYTRSLIINKNSKNKLVIIFMTIIFFLLELKYNILINQYANKELFFKYICSTVIPLFASNLLYTYLTLKGSYGLPLIHRLITTITLLLIPIYPSTDWFVTGSIGLLLPTIIYLLYKYKFNSSHEISERLKSRKGSKIAFTISIILSVLIISFMLGIFKYEPIAMLSNSMHPVYNRGDVLVFEKMSKDDLKKLPENSIIVYRVGNQFVAHRIIKVIENNGVVSYQTKGDNNNAPDSLLVETEQIQGVYRFHIKYVGFPSVWLNDYFNNETAKVETK